MQRPGDEIDIWVVEKALGSGGMGSVYRCRNRSASRIRAAVKVLDSAMRRHPEAQARFVREAEILFSLDHPNIVKVRNIRIDGDPPYLEMEFVEGRSLEELLWRGPIPTAEAIEMMAQCADALAYMHAQGVRHRDIKPANLLVQPDGVVKLVDFGLAVETGGERITKDGVTFGTVSYAPPEWMDPGKLDPSQWDVYALGVVFYEMLLGDVAFPIPEDGNIRQQAMRVMVDKQDHAPLDPGEGYPEALRALIRDMTHADVEARVSSMAKVSATLAELRPEGGQSAVTLIYTTRDAGPSTPPSPPGRMRTLVLGAMGAAGIMAIGLALLVVGLGWNPAPAEAEVQPPPPTAMVAATPTPAPRDVALALPHVPDEVPVFAQLGDTTARRDGATLTFPRLSPGDHPLRIRVGECAPGIAACWPEGPCPPGCVVAELQITVPPEGATSPASLDVPAPAEPEPEPEPEREPTPAPEPVVAPSPAPAAPPTAGPRVTVAQFARWLQAHPTWQPTGELGANQGPEYLPDWQGAAPPEGMSGGKVVTKVSYRAARKYCQSRGTDLARLDEGPKVEDSLLEWRIGPAPDRPAAVGQGQALTTGVPNVMSYTSFRCAR